MVIQETELAGVVVVATSSFSDQRGGFARLFCESELSAVMGDRRIAQINHSRSKAVGTVRGMHFQRPPDAEMKLVRCLKGAVWDVAVDLRLDSATFLRWHAQRLTADNRLMLVIPEGFAHGFQTLEEDTELLYLHTHAYTHEAEGGVACDDPRLAIAWPLPIRELSARDRNHPKIGPGFRGMSL